MKIQGSRRNFMANIVGAAAAAKLMPLMPRAAFGATETPKRLLCVFSPMGYLEHFFWPKGEGSSFQLGETQKVLEPYKSKLLYVNGLMHSSQNTGDRRADRPGVVWDNEHGNGMGGIFTGSMKDLQGKYPLSESIDQTVAKHLYAQKATAYKSIALSDPSGTPGPHTSCFFSGPGEPVTSIMTPRMAYETYFAKLQMGGSGANTAAVARRKLLEQGVIDNVRAEFNAVCSRLGAEERKLCDAHLAGLRSVERRVQDSSSGAPAQCTKPQQPTLKDLEADLRAQMGIIRSVFACDLTRVATLQLGMADGAVDLESMPNQHSSVHAVTADASPKIISDVQLWDRFYAKQWAYLLEQLDSIPEGNGTMLDNTLVLFGSDTTTGQDPAPAHASWQGPGAHDGRRFPMWMAGGSNFAFRTGRQVMLPVMPKHAEATAANKWGHNFQNGKYLYHNALLVSVAQAFGMDINAYGTHDQGIGGVPGLK